MISLEKYLEKGMSFADYEQHIEEVIETGDASSATYRYYPLNQKRMQRLEKTLKIDEETVARISKLTSAVDLLIITEGWCGDAAQILPAIKNMVNLSEHLTEKIVLRDSNPELMNAYLTNGGQAIPIVVGVDSLSKKELFVWGPRPAWAKELLAEYKSGKVEKEVFLKNIQKKYNKDKAKAIFAEITDLLIKT